MAKRVAQVAAVVDTITGRATALRLADVPGAALLQTLLKSVQRQKVATRLFQSKLTTYNNSAAANPSNVTFQVAGALQVPSFTHARPVWANNDPTKSGYFQLSISSPSSLADLNNNNGQWVSSTQAGIGEGLDITLSTEPAPYTGTGANERTAFTVGNWIRCQSSARADGGPGSLINMRCVDLVQDAALPVYGNGNADYSNWINHPTRPWSCRIQAGNVLGTPTAFTQTTEATGGAPIVGVQVLTNAGEVLTIGGLADSIGDGQATFKGSSFYLQIADQLQADLGIPVEYMNCCWYGEVSANPLGDGFLYRGLDILYSPIAPDIFMFPIGSRNNASPGAWTQSIADLIRCTSNEFITECLANGKGCVVSTILPSSNNANPGWGASDSIRRALNAEFMQNYANVAGVFPWDNAANFVGSVDPVTGMEQMDPALSDDRLHPNDAGNGRSAPTAQKAALSIAQGA